MKLTRELLSEIYPDQPLENLKDIKVTAKEIDQVKDISCCKEVRKLNLSNNLLDNEHSLEGLRELKQLTLLNLAHNQFKDFTGFQHFQTLNVLNLSNNQLVHMSPHLTRLKQLKALILGHNDLLEVENIEPLLQLNTLVISHNKIDTMPRLSSLSELTKLSAAHNQLTAVPDLSYNSLLKELRLNDNQIKQIPETLRKCSAIEILDFGNNQLSDWHEIAPIGSLLHLHNLNLKGNPISKKKDYLEKVLDLVPSLRILDGERFDPKFLARKKKQRENVNLLEKKNRLKRIKLQKEKKEKKQDERKVSEKSKRLTVETVKVKKLKTSGDSFFQTEQVEKKTEKKPVEKTEKKPVEKTEKKPVEKMVTKAQTGVLAVVDKTKKQKAPKNVIAELEEQQDNTGTGLGVSGWD